MRGSTDRPFDGGEQDTVQRLQRQAGERRQSVHEERVQNVTVNEAQFDEKWSFVGKKGSPAPTTMIRECGDQWDHVALDVQSRLVVSLVPGRRTEDKTYALVEDFARRANGGQPPALMTSDEYKPYRAALLKTYGVWLVPPRTGRPGRPRQPYPVPPTNLVYAVVHKTRRKGRVVEVQPRCIYGTQQALAARLWRLRQLPGPSDTASLNG